MKKKKKSSTAKNSLFYALITLVIAMVALAVIFFSPVEECNEKSDCLVCDDPHGFYELCEEGKCVPTEAKMECLEDCGAECETDEDCPENFVCEYLSCSCKEKEIECETKEDCCEPCEGPKAISCTCTEGKCYYPTIPASCSKECGAECEEDADCLGGGVCDKASCSCVKGETPIIPSIETSLSTEKQEYEKGEAVKITFESEASDACHVEYQGKDCAKTSYTVKWLWNEEWQELSTPQVKVECPLKVVEPACVQVNQQKVFHWNQTFHDLRTDLTDEPAPTGEYKIALKYKENPNQEEWKTVETKPFFVKGLYWKCPVQEKINCTEPIPVAYQEDCVGGFHDWVDQYCDTQFIY
jgi:hypothetical protein